MFCQPCSLSNLPNVFLITLIVFSNSSHLEPRLVCLVPSVFKSALFSCPLRVLCMQFSLCGTVFMRFLCVPFICLFFRVPFICLFIRVPFCLSVLCYSSLILLFCVFLPWLVCMFLVYSFPFLLIVLGFPVLFASPSPYCSFIFWFLCYVYWIFQFRPLPVSLTLTLDLPLIGFSVILTPACL